MSIHRILLAAGFAASSIPALAADFVGLTTGNQIGMFSSGNPSAASLLSITGLGSGERIVGIDLRPSDNRIYGISSLNRIYTIEAGTGAASFVSALDMPVVNSALSYGIDFNPVADFAGAASLRLVSSTGGNFAVNADSGAVGNAASIIGSGYSAVAYTGSDASQARGPSGTSLYYINTATDTLHFAPSAFNTPGISLVGSLGVAGNVIGANGFEITGNGMAWAALTLDNGDSGLYAIDLMTGLATFSGALHANLRGFTSAPFMAPVPEPETYALMLAGLALTGAVARRRLTAT